MASAIGFPENLLEVPRGTSKTLELTVTDLDCKIIDITGGKVVFSVKEDLGDQNPLIQKTTDVPSEALITKPREGLAEIFLIPDDTHNLDPRADYIYDVWVIQASGDRFVVIPPSTFKITDTVTRIPL